MSENKKTGLGLPLTRGTFQTKGVVFGVAREKFFIDGKTKTGKPWRSINFGLQVSHDIVSYISLSGGEQEKVYFSKQSKTKGEKPEIVSESWGNRAKFNKPDFKLIGVNLGLEKVLDEKGQEINNQKRLVPFDATEYIHEHLKDGMSVFVRGNIEYSHFIAQNGNVVNASKFVPTQISLCKQVNFNEKDTNGNDVYEVVSDFTQPLVFTDIHIGKESDGENPNQFYMGAKIVNYNSIEDGQFVLEDAKLAGNIRKLKSYTFIKTWGKIKTVRNIEPVDEEDGWGTTNSMNKITSPYKKNFLIEGADKDSIDVKTYSEDEIAKAMVAMKSDEKAKQEFGENDWGETKKENDDEDLDVPW
jgi:hypothetical protein